jgi:hypothetical protein
MPMDPATLQAAIKNNMAGNGSRDGLLQKIRDKNPDLSGVLDNGGDLDWLVDSIIEATAEAVADEVIPHIQSNAEVAFAVGDFSGTDSNSDTPDAIAAAGGTIT